MCRLNKMLDFVLLDNVLIFTIEDLDILLKDLTSYVKYYKDKLDDNMSIEEYVKKNAEAIIVVQNQLLQEKKTELIAHVQNYVVDLSDD